MTVHLSLSQRQFVTLSSALDEAIDKARTDAGEALKKHNLARARRRREDAEVYEEIRGLIDAQYSHPSGRKL